MVTHSNSVDKALKSWHKAYVGHDIVFMPPGWKDPFPAPYTFVYVNAELRGGDYISFFRLAHRNAFKNPRVFTPRTLEYASCFHPSFYGALQRNKVIASGNMSMYIKGLCRLKMNEHTSPELDVVSIRYWLQSVIFLAGVTLSAAIIQNRWSRGTLESKLNRLWQLAQYKDIPGLEALQELKIEAFVLECAARLATQPQQVLMELKFFYAEVLKILAEGIPSERKALKEIRLTSAQQERFGFVKELENVFENNLTSIIVYGSATNSAQFADYDLLIVVKNMEQALKKIAGKSPRYNGLELNISLFDEKDFECYQRVSGDNLADHALCLSGSILVPHKSSTDLVARNYSFGFVRFRQLLGMAACYGNIQSATDDKSNLLNYFIKIPVNVFKGIQGCYGSIDTNEDIKKWARETLGFDVTALQEKARNGFSMDSIASAAWATQEVMHWFNKKHHIFYKEYSSMKVSNQLNCIAYEQKGTHV